MRGLEGTIWNLRIFVLLSEASVLLYRLYEDIIEACLASKQCGQFVLVQDLKPLELVIGNCFKRKGRSARSFFSTRALSSTRVLPNNA